jgi:hypothetical protein
MNPPLLKLNFMLECGAILIPAPVEKQQNRRILRGFQHAGTKNSHIISGFAQAQDARAFAGEEKSFVPGCVIGSCSGIGATNIAFLDGLS